MDPAVVHPEKPSPWRDTGLSLLAAAIVVLVYAAWTRPAPQRTETDALDVEHRAGFHRAIGAVEIESQPLDRAVSAIAAAAGAGVVINVDWRQLQATGVERDVPVTLSLRNTTVARALSALRETMGLANDLSFRPQSDGSILISTPLFFDQGPLSTRTYAVGDLIAAAAAFQKALDPGGQRAAVKAGPVGGSGGSALTPPSTPGQLRVALAGELASLVTSVVAPANWRENGGRGAIAVAGDRLIVVQTGEVHAAVEELLRLLRREVRP